MLTSIKHFFIRRKVRNIKGTTIHDQIQKLQLLQRLPAKREPPLHRLRGYFIVSHYDTLGDMVKCFIRLNRNIERNENFTRKNSELVLMEGPISDWAFDIRGEETSLFKSAPTILGELCLFREHLRKWEISDPIYYEYMTRASSDLLLDTNRFIESLQEIYYK